MNCSGSARRSVNSMNAHVTSVGSSDILHSMPSVSRVGGTSNLRGNALEAETLRWAERRETCGRHR